MKKVFSRSHQSNIPGLNTFSQLSYLNIALRGKQLSIVIYIYNTNDKCTCLTCQW